MQSADHVPLLRTGAPPLICVPIVAAERADALRQAEAIRAHDPAPDLVELRADHLKDLELEELDLFLGDLAALLGPALPILFTNRLAAEGGAGAWDAAERAASIMAAITSGHCALADCELATPLAIRQEILDAAHACNMQVIISAHDFAGTPDNAQLDARLTELASAGGDAAKLAVTAQIPDDTLRLLAATQRVRAAARVPLITLAMGPLGIFTRLVGPLFGAVLTFASVGPTSAPGQLPVGLVRDYWRAAGIRE